jgi:uncharacterized small protein (DUF1192 family)
LRRIAELQKGKQRADMDVVRFQDEARRAQIRCSHAQARLDIAMSELGVRDDEVHALRRVLLELRRKVVAPSAESLNRIQQSQAEIERLRAEKRQHKKMAEVTKSALMRPEKQSVRSNLQRLLENTEKSIARIEGKRRMWKEIERKQVFATLSALSLVREVGGTFEETLMGRF